MKCCCIVQECELYIRNGSFFFFSVKRSCLSGFCQPSCRLRFEDYPPCGKAWWVTEVGRSNLQKQFQKYRAVTPKHRSTKKPQLNAPQAYSPCALSLANMRLYFDALDISDTVAVGFRDTLSLSFGLRIRCWEASNVWSSFVDYVYKIKIEA